MSNAVVAGAGPTKQELETVFSRLRAQAANKACFDCAAKAPTWSSVTYGIFICIDCSAVHRNLGVHLTFVRSTNLDTNWTWLQLRQMQLGGNANAAQFFRAHNCNSTDAQVKYNSRAAQLYRDKLSNLATQAMKVHGTKLHLDPAADKTEGNASKQPEEEDFFAECVGADLNTENNNTNLLSKLEINPKPAKPANTAAAGEQLSNISGAAAEPSVDLLNSILPPATAQSTIGVRKIQPKKTGLGARKVGGGLGATKVKTNFADIEARANAANQFQEATPIVNEKPRTEEEQLETAASMRLAYQDLSMQQTRQEAKMKTIDPAKAKQMERLGMGFNLRGSDVSHSAISDMNTIQQTAAPKVTTQSQLAALENELSSDYTPNMYGSSGVSSSSGSGGNTGSSSYRSKLDKHELEIMGFETIEPIGSNITSMFSGNDADSTAKTNAKTSSNILKSTNNYNATRSSNNRNNKPASNANDPDTAQQKFGNAKGFGSDQYFASEQSTSDNSSNLNRFQGSRAISSSDYFGDSSGLDSTGGGGNRGYSNSVNFQAPDLDDVKESVRQGVHKVAGRLSNLANDVMSSLQDKYGY